MKSDNNQETNKLYTSQKTSRRNQRVLYEPGGLLCGHTVFSFYQLSNKLAL